MLFGVKMYGLAQAVSEPVEQGAPAFDAALPILSQVLKVEGVEREVRSIAGRIKAAVRPGPRTDSGPWAAPRLQAPRQLRLHVQRGQ